MKALLLWLTGYLPYRVYSHAGVPFLERYFVCKLFGTTVYVHRFVASDPDRGLHDHPWGWAFSLVLSGWYAEARRDGRLRIVNWFNRLRGDTFHRVVLPRVYDPCPASPGEWPAQECWTLFIHGPNVKRWGFLRPVEGAAGASFYCPHVDRDGDADSAAWARTASTRRGASGGAP